MAAARYQHLCAEIARGQTTEESSLALDIFLAANEVIDGEAALKPLRQQHYARELDEFRAFGSRPRNADAIFPADAHITSEELLAAPPYASLFSRMAASNPPRPGVFAASGRAWPAAPHPPSAAPPPAAPPANAAFQDPKDRHHRTGPPSQAGRGRGGKRPSDENADPSPAPPKKAIGAGFMTAKETLIETIAANPRGNFSAEARAAAATPAAPPARGRSTAPVVCRPNGGAQATATAGGDAPVGPSPQSLLLLLRPGETTLPASLSALEPSLLDRVCRDVLAAPTAVTWDDISGLERAKRVVQEEVVWPLLNPSFFTGPRAPAKGILLFGPPGTGKTLVGRAIASQVRGAFFAISASSLTSKWIGEAEATVKALFAVARHLAPSVVFVDEIDAVLGSRGAEGEHESSRRLKTEVLVQMEGVDGGADGPRVIVVGATNRPHDLDEGVRRRLSRHIYVPLPDETGRRQLITRALATLPPSGPGAPHTHALSDGDMAGLVRRTTGYSGSDLRALMAEALRQPLRDAAAEAAAAGRGVGSVSHVRPVTLMDFRLAVTAVKPSVGEAEVTRHEAWDAAHGLGRAAEAAADLGDW